MRHLLRHVLLSPLLLFAALASSFPIAGAAELATGTTYGVVELTFRGPTQTPRDCPARDVDLRVTLRHESGAPAYTLRGFWDGDGKDGASGDVFVVRFCPTRPGRWEVSEIAATGGAFRGPREGDHVTAQESKHPGFWLPDRESAGGIWYKRSDGSHPYIFGNTQYSFLSGHGPDGPTKVGIAEDVVVNSAYFKKLRFCLTGDRYPHPVERPFFDAEGKPTDSGDHAHRPNPRWFRQRADAAVRAAYGVDVIADLILAGPDTVASRATLRAAGNGGDPSVWLRYVAARYGSYPNVWCCIANEYDIKEPRWPEPQVARFGKTLHEALAYPTPVSVHASQHPGSKKRQPEDPAWSTVFDSFPGWNDHQILQRKIRALAPAADVIRRTWENPGAKPRLLPTINDELSYQGAGDKHDEGDTLASHLGAFLGGGYGSTGYKSGNKLGHYFWGGFTPMEHTAAHGLKFLREAIDKNVTFWKMSPNSEAFNNLDRRFRAMAWPGREYVLGTDAPQSGLVAQLPSGSWTVTRFDVVARTTTRLTDSAFGRYTFDAPDSRAVLFLFKKNAGTGPGR